MAAAGRPLGFLLANGAFFVLTLCLGHNTGHPDLGGAFYSWGWRMPFLLSAVMVAVGLYVRLRLAETPVFTRALARGERVKAPVAEVIRNNWRALIIGTFVMLATYTLFYVVNTWTLSYAIAARPPKGNGLGIVYMNFLQMQLISVLFFAAMLPVVGWLADRFGRRSTLLVSTLAIIAYGATFGPLLASGRATPASVLTFLVVGMSLMGLSFGPMSAVLPELFGTNVRYTGSGIAYNLASILGAAVAPFIATWLAATHGVGWVGFYLSVSAGVTFIALLAMRETKDRPLDAEPEQLTQDVCPAES